MTLENLVEIMNYADQLDLKVSVYINGKTYLVAYMDVLTDDPQRAWRDLRIMEMQLLCAA